jgi:hypothetical protein
VGLSARRKLDGPTAVILAPDNSVVVFDSNNNRLRRLDATNINTIAGNGAYASTGDGGLAINASLNFPTGGVYGKDGSLYVVEGLGHRVRRIASNGIISTIAGTGVAGSSGDNGPAINAQLHHPRAIAISSDGNYLFVTETSRVRQINLGNGNIYPLAGNGTPGMAEEGGWSTTAPLGGNWISASGNVQTVGALSSVAVLSDGRVLVADRANHKIHQISKDYKITTFAGSGQPGYTGDGFYNEVKTSGGGALRQAALNQPTALHVDAFDNLYFSDFSNYAVRKFTAPVTMEVVHFCNGILDPSVIRQGFDVRKLDGCILSGTHEALITYEFSRSRGQFDETCKNADGSWPLYPAQCESVCRQPRYVPPQTCTATYVGDLNYAVTITDPRIYGYSSPERGLNVLGTTTQASLDAFIKNLEDSYQTSITSVGTTTQAVSGGGTRTMTHAVTKPLTWAVVRTAR